MCTKHAQPGSPTQISQWSFSISTILFQLPSLKLQDHISCTCPSPAIRQLPSSHPETAPSWFSSIPSFLAGCFSSRKNHSNSYFLYVFVCYNRMAGNKISNDHSSFLSPFSEASFVRDIPVVPTSSRYFSPVSRSQHPRPSKVSTIHTAVCVVTYSKDKKRCLSVLRLQASFDNTVSVINVFKASRQTRYASRV